MMSKDFTNTFIQFLKHDSKKGKRRCILPNVKFFEVILHNFFGSFLNLIKLKLKRTQSYDLKLLNYISMSEKFCAFYEQIIIPFCNLYCFFKNIDFSEESVNIFINNVKKRRYIIPLIWFIKNPYKIFAVTIKNILYKNIYA